MPGACSTTSLTTRRRSVFPPGTGWNGLTAPHSRPSSRPIKARLKALAGAQADGRLTRHFTPAQLLTLIQAMAVSWGTMNPEFAAAASKVSRRDRRRAVIDAVCRLVA